MKKWVCNLVFCASTIACTSALAFSGYGSGSSGYGGYSGYGGSSYGGSSGSSGLDGLTGATSGTSGTSGTGGTSGSSGLGGFSGLSGLSGSSRWSGLSGLSGSSRWSGLSGLSGSSRWSGLSGLSGSSRWSGLSGGSSGWSGLGGLSSGSTGGSVNSSAGGSNCTVFRPNELSQGHPVILWGNGTGASVSSYSRLLQHWASQGFVVVAANTPNAGSGQEMLGCLEWVASSELAANIDLSKVGASGHSQGAGGAIQAGEDPRVVTTAPIQGYAIGRTVQTGPMLILSGSNDTIIAPDRFHTSLFSGLSVPTFWAILQGATHFEPSMDGGGYRDITTEWFLYQLRGDADAAAKFEGPNCGYCNNSAWVVQRKNM